MSIGGKKNLMGKSDSNRGRSKLSEGRGYISGVPGKD